MRVKLTSDSGKELREYNFPDDWSLTITGILGELIVRAYK